MGLLLTVRTELARRADEAFEQILYQGMSSTQSRLAEKGPFLRAL
jgi:hypothetical protein